MGQYLRGMHANLATGFKPEDIYLGNLAGGLTQLNGGVTTLFDWCHNNPTPEHTDAAIDGLFNSGIRAVFGHGSPKPDPKEGQKHFTTEIVANEMQMLDSKGGSSDYERGNSSSAATPTSLSSPEIIDDDIPF